MNDALLTWGQIFARIAQQFLHRAALRLAVLAAFLGDQASGCRGNFRTKIVVR